MFKGQGTMFNLAFLSQCGKIRACWNLQNNRAANKGLKEGNLFEMEPYLITCWICRRLRVCLRWKGLWGERRSLGGKRFSPSLERRQQQGVRGRPRLPRADLPALRRAGSLKPIIPIHYGFFADFFFQCWDAKRRNHRLNPGQEMRQERSVSVRSTGRQHVSHVSCWWICNLTFEISIKASSWENGSTIPINKRPVVEYFYHNTKSLSSARPSLKKILFITVKSTDFEVSLRRSSWK